MTIFEASKSIGDVKTFIRASLMARTRNLIPKENLKGAAVLIPLCWVEGSASIILTKRSMEVEHHKGEISFPGGREEPEDAGVLDTALREAFEETGILRDDVDVLGFLDDYITIFGFHVTPVVGVIPGPYKFSLNSESDEIVTLAFSDILTDEKWMSEKTSLKGKDVDIFFIEADKGVIWGATAKMLKNLAEILLGRAINPGHLNETARTWMENLFITQTAYKP